MNSEITLSFLWKIFVDSWKKILVVTLIAAIAVGCFTAFLIDKKYSSKVTFFVINSNVGSVVDNTSNLNATDQLATNYIQIILSDTMLDPLVETLKTEKNYDYDSDDIRKMISSSKVSGSSMFEIKVTNTNKEHACVIADYIGQIAPDTVLKVVRPWLFNDKLGEVNDLTKDDISPCISIINDAVEAKTHDSPSLTKNVFIAAFAAIVLTYGICLMIAFFDTVIKSEEDIKQFTQKYPLIGTIPTWTAE